jgi:hypothetical protein
MANGVNAIGNLQGKVDANNQLVVALGSGSTLPNDIDVDAGTGTAEAGVGGVLYISTTSAQTGANTTETDLQTYSLPANTLSTNTYGVRITAWGTTAANGNDKTLKIYFGATAVVNTGAGSNNAHTWRSVAEVFRTGASAQEAIGVALSKAGGAWNGSMLGQTTSSQPAADTTAAITIKVTGLNGTASAGDLVCRGMTVEFLRAGA